MPNKYKMKFIVEFNKAWEGDFQLGIIFSSHDYSHMFSDNNETSRWVNKLIHREAYLMIHLGKFYITIGRIAKPEYDDEY